MDGEKFFKFSQNVFQYLGLWTRNCEKNHTFKARCIRYAVKFSSIAGGWLIIDFIVFQVIYFSGGIIPVLSVFDTLAAARTATVFAALTKVLFGFAYLMCVHKVVAAGANGTKIYLCIRRLEMMALKFEDRTDFKACLRGYEKAATIDAVATNACAFTFMAAALVTKEFPYNCNLPHLDFTKSPNYEIMFTYQTLAVAMVANALIAYDMVFCGLMYVCCGVISSIRREIRQIDIRRDDGKVSENALKEIVEKIIETSSIIRQISDTFSLTTITSIFYNSSVMAFGLLMISYLPPSDMTWITMICAVIAVTFQIWIYCYFGQLVINERERLKVELYCTNWYNGSKNFRTMMLMTIFEVQQERNIKAGNLLPLSLETLTAVLKKAYAFYAFFKRVAV